MTLTFQTILISITMEQKKIFIVEDDLVLLETIQDILLDQGFDCQGCFHPENAIRMIEKYRPDLVLLDYMLPEWNGGELCSAIRAIDGFEYTPIIITSAYAKILLSISDYGCDAVIEKPFRISDLIGVINSQLCTRRSDSGLLPKIKKVVKSALPLG
ncbi:two-component system response regulator VicR [Pedobacter agri]|nr:two-component system response regulator VicR [Pedobacter agri]